MPAGGSYEWHIGQSTRPFVGATGQREAYELTCEQADGAVLERLSLVIDRGQRAALNIGCGAAPTTFANGAPVGGSPSAPPATAPAVNGVAVPAGVAPQGGAEEGVEGHDPGPPAARVQHARQADQERQEAQGRAADVHPPVREEAVGRHASR